MLIMYLCLLEPRSTEVLPHYTIRIPAQVNHKFTHIFVVSVPLFRQPSDQDWCQQPGTMGIDDCFELHQRQWDVWGKICKDPFSSEPPRMHKPRLRGRGSGCTVCLVAWCCRRLHDAVNSVEWSCNISKNALVLWQCFILEMVDCWSIPVDVPSFFLYGRGQIISESVAQAVWTNLVAAVWDRYPQLSFVMSVSNISCNHCLQAKNVVNWRHFWHLTVWFNMSHASLMCVICVVLCLQTSQCEQPVVVFYIETYIHQLPSPITWVALLSYKGMQMSWRHQLSSDCTP